ncbi:hypothetical protein ACMFMF_002111 [Clarireedia jacksonii]
MVTRSQTKHSRDQIAARQDPSKFIYFKFLPPEIRHWIWELSRTRRYIKLRQDRKTSQVYHPSIPPILHTCSESRYIGLRHYRLAFGTNPPSEPSDARVWFDFSNDGLMLYCNEAVGCPAHRIWWPRENGFTCTDRDLVQRIVWESPLNFQPMGNIASMFKNCIEAKIIQSPSLVHREDVLYEDDFAVTEEPLWVAQGTKSLSEYWLRKKMRTEQKKNKLIMLERVERVEVMSRKIGMDGKRVMKTERGQRVEMLNGRMVVSGTVQFGPLPEWEMIRAEGNGT